MKMNPARKYGFLLIVLNSPLMKVTPATDCNYWITFFSVSCNIIKHQKNTARLRCFDVSFPFVGIIHHFRCTVHGTTFRLTDPEVVDQVKDQHCKSSYVFFPRTIVTKAFLTQVYWPLYSVISLTTETQVVGLYLETFNFEKTARIIQQTWLSSLYAQILQVQIFYFKKLTCTDSATRKQWMQMIWPDNCSPPLP